NEALQANFKTEVSKNVSLFTIRNANMDKLDRLYEGKNILLEQIAKNTVQIVIL
ncbi:aspartate kinase, partial [Escherichia coli]|nr:aspartate kinase [Escherichia coli]